MALGAVGGEAGLGKKSKFQPLFWGWKAISELEMGLEQPGGARGTAEGHLGGNLQLFHLLFHAGHPLGSEGPKAGLCVPGGDEEHGCPSPLGPTGFL